MIKNLIRKFEIALLLASITLVVFPFASINTCISANALTEDFNYGTKTVIADSSCDVLDGHEGSCYQLEENNEVVSYALESKSTCNSLSATHGPGRENGGVSLVSTGCRNYISNGFKYGTVDIPYWINMSSINQITNSEHRNKILSDIREQTKMWNEVKMYDGTGQIVNVYEVASNTTTKPAKVNGKNVIEILQADLTSQNYAGMFSPSTMTVSLGYSNQQIKYNIDTVVHEFGHVLGLGDLESKEKNIPQGTHKTLMGYSRGTTEQTLSTAIKYQDIQGIAVTSGRHVCKDSDFKRYVKQGNEYLHICYYCDQIDRRTSAITGSEGVLDSVNCKHSYGVILSAGKRYWLKCSKCYEVIENDLSNRNILFDGGVGTQENPFLIRTAEQFRNMQFATKKAYETYQGDAVRIHYHYKLVDNIDLGEDWTPFSLHFAGRLNGDNHYITYKTTISKGDLESTPYWGLFGFVGRGNLSGKIENLELRDCSIVSDGSLSVDYNDGSNPCIGIVAGSIYSCDGLENVRVVNPKIDCKIANARIGGLAGTSFSSNLTNCVVTGGSITSNNGSLGGMAGRGEIYSFKGGTCSTTITKTSYKKDDQVGKVLGNTTETGSVDVSSATLNLKEDSCIAQGTLITLADGRQVPVEELTGNEMLLVWNFHTGRFDTAPIIFIDRDPQEKYTVINLTFSDGTKVNVISEHGFWDYDLNQYVYLDEDAAQYIGHWFNKQETDESGNRISVRVQLTGVDIREEETVAYSPVTYAHLCYYVNGMLSMPGGISGLFNIFEVDEQTMCYDEALMTADIETYGLYTYEEFAEQFPVSEEVFRAFGGQYLKVAIGKGLIDEDTITYLIARYSEFFVS